ncbi:MAG: tyrosine--tRNA ligase [Acidilobaceae archaeon]|nr:tyrosine--tRNA ligase [Acidilobaceae archaeon]MCX8165136.1 tyrosine--tRNA ligase [Acidilobaceae archaeon]MDW7974348.1 tyrosine--tRNA ligase [Sulfolobales archaeon]
MKLELVKRNAVEIIAEEELVAALQGKPKGYIGYEPSGLVHVGWLVWMFKVADLVEAGVDFTVLEASWHAYVNDKLGGDMELIREASWLVREYMSSLSLPVEKIKFVDAEEIASDKNYWALVLGVAKGSSLARIKRALTIMGRRAEEADIDASKLIYPAMQVADMFYLGIDIALGGMDQRKAHMLARDIAERAEVRRLHSRLLGRELKKPVAIHTPIVSGLQGAQRMEGAEVDEIYAEAKMSKSRPETAIFLHDPPELIEEKLRKAYCPPKVLEGNPVIEINRYVLAARGSYKLEVDRPAKYGGPITFTDEREMEAAYARGELHPLDLKVATARALSELLKPVRAAAERGRAREVIERISRRVTR